jgi:hypothetical protein
MATGTTNDGLFNLPYPLAADPVNVHGDIKSLADRLLLILPPLGLSQFQLGVINDSGEYLPAGTPVFVSGYDSVHEKPQIDKCLPTTEKPILGLLKQPLEDGSEGIVVVAGVMEDVNTSGFADGDVLYVGSDGGLSTTQYGGAVGVVAYAASNGIIIVEAKGNGTWGALKAGLA